MHETVRKTWLSILTEFATLRVALSKVTWAETATSQYVEVGMSRMRRDGKDNLEDITLIEKSPLNIKLKGPKMT